MSTLSVGTIQSNTSAPPVVRNSSNTEIGTFCRAWVNFNGTGTVAIRASGNVSSITDGGVGVYTVNFTTAMPDANYSVSCGYTPDIAFTSGAAAARMTFVVSQSTGSFVLNTGFQSNGSAVGVGLLDFPAVNVAIFR